MKNKCKQWIPSMSQLAEICNGDIIVTGEGPDETQCCVRCGSRWSMDSKDAEDQSVAGA